MSNELGIKVGDFVRVKPSSYTWTDYESHYIFEVMEVSHGGLSIRIVHDANFNPNKTYHFANYNVLTHYPVNEYVRVTDGNYNWSNYDADKWYPVVYDYPSGCVTIHISDDVRFDPYSTFTFFEHEILERKEV